jgi:acyl-CoA thioesterase
MTTAPAPAAAPQEAGTTASFLGVQGTAHRALYRLPITDRVCVGPPGNVFMFGGVGLAAAIVAAERLSGRNLVWGSAQFLSYARVGDTLDLAVEEVTGGRNVSQVRVVATDAGKTILTVSGALGDRTGMPDGQWMQPPPDMPAPEDCKPMPLWPVQDAALMDRLDIRLAPGRYGGGPRDGTPSEDGRMVMWIRPKENVAIDAAMLAIFADFVPSGLAAAFGRPGGGNSLDNTLRIIGIVPTRWVLCDVRISGASRGFGHGAIHMYAEDGSLIASGSQSAIVRFSPR